jgi:putative Mn2+ efflux pump MntP
MSLIEIIILAIGLSMDAAAVSISDILSNNKLDKRKILIIALAFGVFQGLMPLMGFYTVAYFRQYITKFAPWIALIIYEVNYLVNLLIYGI